MQVLRQIVKIDDERCTGCGDCILACAESAIEIVDGKARLVGENLCDGFGVCLDKCPEDAIEIEEREAEVFDEDAVSARIASLWISGPAAQPQGPSSPVTAPGESAPSGPAISHWPIKLNLVPPNAPFLQDADVVLMADCVPFACGERYKEYVLEHALLIGCPKFDDPSYARTRLTDILRQSDVRSLTVVHMEVPCCGGYWHLGREACAASEKDIPLQQVVIGIRGDVKQT